MRLTFISLVDFMLTYTIYYSILSGDLILQDSEELQQCCPERDNKRGKRDKDSCLGKTNICPSANFGHAEMICMCV